MASFLRHPYFFFFFKKGVCDTAEESFLTQNINERRKPHTGDHPDKEVEKNVAFKNKGQVWRNHCLECLIQTHLSPPALPYLVMHFQSTVCHICNPFKLDPGPRGNDA